jgi:hypothetical protein
MPCHNPTQLGKTVANHRKKVNRRDIGLGALGMTTGSLLLTLTLGIVSPVVPTALADAQINAIGVGGTGDTQGKRIFDKLNGEFANPLIYNDQGVAYSAVYFPINQSVDAAVPTLDQQIAADQGQPTGILGYSQGTLVIVKWMKNQEGKPVNPDILGVILMAAPNTPNGGIYARYPWLQGNPLIEAAGFDFNGAVPNDSGYPVLIVNRQYDPYGDSPLDPLNPLADLNSLAAVEEVHPDANYDNINLSALPEGSTTSTYIQSNGKPFVVITVPNEHLPLLMPFYQTADAAGVKALAAPVLDLIEPTLTWGVELGYDRTLPANQAAPAQPGSSLARLPGALPRLPEVIQQGASSATTDLASLGPSSITTPDPSKLPPVPGASTLSLPAVPSTSSMKSKSGNLFSPTTLAGPNKKPGVGNPVSDALGAVSSVVKQVTDTIGSLGKPNGGSSPSEGSTGSGTE